MINKVKDQLLKTYPQELVDSILDSYTQLAENFMRSKIRPSEVEGGRFCEATIRMLQYKTTGTYTPMGTSLNLDTEINVLRNLPATSFDDSIRLHIPRTIRVIYDIRSKRDSAHLGNINPNLMDGTLVINSHPSRRFSLIDTIWVIGLRTSTFRSPPHKTINARR